MYLGSPVKTMDGVEPTTSHISKNIEVRTQHTMMNMVVGNYSHNMLITYRHLSDIKRGCDKVFQFTLLCRVADICQVLK